jgi:hypothetical protein
MPILENVEENVEEKEKRILLVWHDICKRIFLGWHSHPP